MKPDAVKPEVVAYLRRVMQKARGDDLERAERAFSLFSEKELESMKYGTNKKTCAEVLRSLRAERQRWQEANELLEYLLTGADQ